MNDGYGSNYREAMKRSMSQPAAQWKPLNHREERKAWLKWIAALMGLFGFFEMVYQLLERVKK